MTVEALLALSTFAFATSITPGPNNMMLLASGVNFGFRRTIPHMLGIGFGFAAMLVVVGLGLGAALTATPGLLTVLRLVSAGYMLWLAWRLASSGSIGSAVGAANPMRFIEAAGFQWMNPKAWAMALTATTVYTRPDAFLATVLIVALVFGSINLPSVSVWAAFGTGLRGFLAIPARMRVFNIAMAGLLALSIIPFVL